MFASLFSPDVSRKTWARMVVRPAQDISSYARGWYCMLRYLLYTATRAMLRERDRLFESMVHDLFARSMELFPRRDEHLQCNARSSEVPEQLLLRAVRTARVVDGDASHMPTRANRTVPSRCRVVPVGPGGAERELHVGDLFGKDQRSELRSPCERTVGSKMCCAASCVLDRASIVVYGCASSLLIARISSELVGLRL